MNKSPGLWSLIGLFPALLIQNLTLAQIVPDATLPVNSRITVQDATDLIEGGTTSGTHLFHSFSEFSIPTGRTAHFDNAPNIQTIFTRITGNSISEIDGLIRANGTTNLFLLNPNGIVFGPNAALDIGGSFLGTTAESVTFADGFEFSASNPQVSPLLTVSAPVGLVIGGSAGRILVQGMGHELSRPDPIFGPIVGAGSSTMGLRVQPGKNLALIGSGISIEGGLLTAPGGHIILSSISNDTVNLSVNAQGIPELSFDSEILSNFRDIEFLNRSLADTSGMGSGTISIWGKRISIREGSVIARQNQGTEASGDLTITATDSLEVNGTASDLSIRTTVINETLGQGTGGNVIVSAPRLAVEKGAGLGTTTFGLANAGSIRLNIRDFVNINQFIPLDPRFFSVVISLTFGSGNAGDVTVNSHRVSIVDGGSISSGTFGTGNGGNVNMFADTVEIIRSVPLIFQPSTLSANAFNAGNSGNVSLQTARLIMEDGGTITTAALASGNSGNILINASEFVEISGGQPGSVNRNSIAADAALVDPARQALFNLPDGPSGTSGNVVINTPRLIVNNDTAISATNDGTGSAGEIIINAREIFLSNRGAITALTTSGEGGNILLNTSELQLRNSSVISATAKGTGNGGNISINTEILTALENSDITANSLGNFGGRVSIDTLGIFGTMFRDRPSDLTSDITATSERGAEFSGIVTLNTPELDPTAALVPLETNFLDPSGQIATGCQGDENSFIVVGRGGIPASPTDPLSETRILTDLGSSQPERITPPQSRTPAPTNEYLEATQWQVNEQGQVVLVAAKPNHPKLDVSCAQLSDSSADVR